MILYARKERRGKRGEPRDQPPLISMEKNGGDEARRDGHEEDRKRGEKNGEEER